MPKISEILARNLAHYRKLRKLSPEALAKEIGVSRQTINNLEKQRTGASFDTIAKLAIALQIEETDLVNPAPLPAEPPAPPPAGPKPPTILDHLEAVRALVSDLKKGDVGSPAVRELLQLIGENSRRE